VSRADKWWIVLSAAETKEGRPDERLIGDHPDLGSALLHHTDKRTRNEHYHRASCLSAGQSYLDVVNRYRA
jgi:hypothetical protein